jgi:hypothetical protein
LGFILKIYLALPTQETSPAILRLADQHRRELEAQGHEVYSKAKLPQIPQLTGEELIEYHREAVLHSEAVHVVWNIDSRGSFFELGALQALAYMFSKPLTPLVCHEPEPEHWITLLYQKLALAVKR